MKLSMINGSNILQVNSAVLNGASSFSMTFVRHGSRGKKIEYPYYRFQKLKNVNPKLHQTNLRHAMKQFLGPKNYKGEYYLNKYYQIPSEHIPNYIFRDNGKSLINDSESHKVDRRQLRDKLRPFPSNNKCYTNSIISEKMKSSIIHALDVEQKAIQQVAYQYDISVPRIEALVSLNRIEERWKAENKITSDLKRMADTLYGMFPLYNPRINPENLTEIPVPAKTLKSRFLTIAESEPFGPVDAANVLGLEPAAVTLEKLSQGHKVADKQQSESRKVGFFAPVMSHEKVKFRFTSAKVGEVGIRYGKSNRDNKKNRKIGYNEIGQRVYV